MYSSRKIQCDCPMHAAAWDGVDPFTKMGAPDLKYQPVPPDEMLQPSSSSSRPTTTTTTSLIDREEQQMLSPRIQALERSLQNKLVGIGPTHQETANAWSKLLGEYNQEAMHALSLDNIEKCRFLLKRAKKLISCPLQCVGEDERRQMLAIVYNNLSCMCRRTGMLTNALKMGQKALILETTSSLCDNPAATHLNLAAIQSQLGKHKHALEHIECAIHVIHKQEELELENEHKIEEEEEEVQQKPSDKAAINPKIERIIQLAMCYHGQGAQLEHLRNYSNALASYKQAIKTLKKHPDYQQCSHQPVHLHNPGASDERMESSSTPSMTYLIRGCKHAILSIKQLLAAPKTSRTSRADAVAAATTTKTMTMMAQPTKKSTKQLKQPKQEEPVEADIYDDEGFEPEEEEKEEEDEHNIQQQQQPIPPSASSSSSPSPRKKDLKKALEMDDQGQYVVSSPVFLKNYTQTPNRLIHSAATATTTRTKMSSIYLGEAGPMVPDPQTGQMPSKKEFSQKILSIKNSEYNPIRNLGKHSIDLTKLRPRNDLITDTRPSRPGFITTRN